MSRSTNNYQKLQRDHLKQLISTRAEILQELNVTDPSGARPPRSRAGTSTQARGNVRLPKINKSGLSQTAGYPLPPPSNLMLTMPSMNSSVSSSSSSKSKKKDSGGTVVVKLPIFRMPTADVTSFLNATKLEEARLQTQSGSRKRHFLSYSDFKTMRKAFLLMLQQMTTQEKDPFIYQLYVAYEDFDDAILQLKRKLDSNTTSTSYTDLLSRPKLMDDFFAVDDHTSLFLFAKNANISSSNSSLSTRSVATMDSSLQKQSLRAVSAGMNLKSIGISNEFQEFLLAEDALRLNAINMSAQNFNSTKGKSNNNHQPASLVQHRSANDLLRSNSSSQLMHEMDSKQLSTALLTSLMSVQKHTNAMKRSLESAQALVSNLEKTAMLSGSNTPNPHNLPTATSNSKAKEMLFMLAAERMQKGLYSLVLFDLRRGLAAWRIYVQQDRRVKRMKVLLHGLVVRNMILGFQKILHRLLSQNLQIWHQAAVAETQRLQKERFIKSTIKIQSWMRKHLAIKKVKYLRQRKKYEQLYDATIRIQSLLRGKCYRWRYIRMVNEMKRDGASRLIQRVYRGYQGRKRVAILKLRKNRHLAATMIQCMIRCHIARGKVRELRRARVEKLAATRVQAIVRGFVARRNISEMIINRVRYLNAVRIQSRVRGALTRMNRHKKIKEIQEYREMRGKAATKMQSLYRGYRNRIIYKIMCFQLRKEKDEQNKAATQINRIVRGFNARKLLERMKEERYDSWVEMARKWKEMWSDDSQTWFYSNEETGEALWEPSRDGYIKADGQLVLCNGDIIDDPFAPKLDENGQPSSEPVVEKKKVKKVLLSKLCSECSENMAIRKCHECGDQFCTRCYKATHNVGARRNHTYVPIGPKSCDDCECLIAERYCVSCDENFCDKCWRKLHSHGKRVFHPYCEISPEGRVDARIFTMDGDQLEEGYDATYAQQRIDSQQISSMAMTIAQQQQQNAYNVTTSDYYNDQSSDVNTTDGVEEWTMYYDDNGYPYYYNNYTGASQYENPYE